MCVCVCVCVCVGYMINAHMTIPHTINAHRKMRTVIFAHMNIPHTDKSAHGQMRTQINPHTGKCAHGTTTNTKSQTHKYIHI